MKPKAKIVTLAMPPRILREVDRLARSDGRSRSAFVARALDRVIADAAELPDPRERPDPKQGFK